MYRLVPVNSPQVRRLSAERYINVVAELVGNLRWDDEEQTFRIDTDDADKS